MKKLAVIQFPGSNCEYETRRAAAYYGFEADIIRWNCEPSEFDGYDAYILPGGFSYQDRVRAGVVAAKLDIVSNLDEASRKGKPILGICNGCQILAETGLIPNLDGEQKIDICLSENTKSKKSVGFICDWVYVKIKNPSASLFTSQFLENEVIPIPINHGEGRFVLRNSLSSQIADLSKFIYCDKEGNETNAYPVNPNGSELNLAGIGNRAGNVMGIMPHPERAAFSKQVPEWLGELGTGSDEGPWSKIFVALYEGTN